MDAGGGALYPAPPVLGIGGSLKTGQAGTNAVKFSITVLLCGIICLGTAFGEETEAVNAAVTLVRVRIIINNDLYEWTEAGITLPGETTAALTGRTVVSFTALHPGRRYTLEDLERECQKTRYRLEESGYFYSAAVTVVPPRRNPAERTVVIEVTQGFLMRFSGGYAYGMFGWAGLGGERQELRLYGGWNQNGAAYINHRTGGLPLLLGGSLFYYGPGGETRLGLPVDTRPLEGTLNTAFYAGPDFLAGVTMDMTVPLGENHTELPGLSAANP
jgi:hypothetical protein